MWRAVGRLGWWLFAFERPTWPGDYLALLGLFLLAGLGALAIAWPWVSAEVPRLAAQLWADLQRLLASGLAYLAQLIDHLLKLLERLPRFR